jgi:hypothetical protein
MLIFETDVIMIYKLQSIIAITSSNASLICNYKKLICFIKTIARSDVKYFFNRAGYKRIFTCKNRIVL